MPASYPDSVKSFTTKLDGAGNNINAAHVNDIQDEVNAIESGILNGTARINSSNISANASTVGSLKVTGITTLGTAQVGASTLASLNVDGASTFTGTVQVTGASSFTVRPVEPPSHLAFVFIDSSYTLGSSAASTVKWTGQSAVTNSSMHSTTTNNDRLTPQSTGVYQCAAQIFFSRNDSGARNVIVVDSSAGTIARSRLSATIGDDSVMHTVGYKRFDVLGGFMQVQITMTGTGGGSTMSLEAGVGQTWACLQKL